MPPQGASCGFRRFTREANRCIGRPDEASTRQPQVCAHAGFDGGRRRSHSGRSSDPPREGLMQAASAQSEAQSPCSGSWLYMLERFDIGVVRIDRKLRVVGMNESARRCLPAEEKLPFGKLVTSLHPKASRAKVQFLIGQAECPVSRGRRSLPCCGAPIPFQETITRRGGAPHDSPRIRISRA